MPYRLDAEAGKDNRTFNLYSYSFNLDANKQLRSFTLPNNRDVLVLAITLVP